MHRRAAIAGLAAAVAAGTSGQAKSAAAAPAREGFAPVPGGKVWCRMVGSGPRTPILTLHGGPGAGHDYLTPLEALSDQRPVILYDQLGCGRSDAPDDNRLYRIARFSDEIDAVRAHLGVGKVILYGHSWGGWLALDYMARRGPKAPVEALVLASTSASVRQFVDGAQRLLAALPNGAGARLKQLEAQGKSASPEYAAIVDRFYDAHLVHFDGPPPPFAGASNANIARSKTYPVMNGPNEFTVTGTLKSFDRTRELPRIHVPTLVLTSSLDEVTLDCHQTLHRGIAGSKLVVIPGARHLAMVEKPREYVAALRAFTAPLA